MGPGAGRRASVGPRRHGGSPRHLVRHPDDYLDAFGAGRLVDPEALRELGVTSLTKLHAFVRDSETLHRSLVEWSLLRSKAAAAEAQKAVRSARDTAKRRHPGAALGRDPQEQIDNLDLLRGSHPYSADPELYLRARRRGREDFEPPGPW